MLIDQADAIDFATQANFNTSHVNVNLLDFGGFIDLNTNFNTSHVNVNPLSLSSMYWNNIISIHLMLMLIGLARGTLSQVERFQYISC